MISNLENFTDVLGDEICDSQPISWPSSNISDSDRLIVNKDSVPINRPAKRTGQYGQFRSVEEIDPKYRNVFSYPYFNLVQSNVIEDALYSDKSIVVCAPTGSGKTVVFEMAIVQLLMEIDDKNYTEDFKIIYMAPVKALCTERLSEWYPKFTKLGLLCIEVTGDTDVDFSQLKPYRIIITTPEKWDMLTRRWRDHKGLVEVIKLFLIDEVHILNDDSRGPVLEAVVSRMKTIESSAQSTHRIEQLQKQYQGNNCIGEVVAPPGIRFVAVSATVSNPEDVASWLGNSDKPAVYHKYGDECRPVKLKRVVEGYPCQDGTSIFKFDIILNYKLWPIIQKYHDGKPTLIFCNTRKSVILTAETLSRELTITFNADQKAKLTALASSIKNKKLQSLVLSGVGCHHAGLLFEERMNIEHAFRNRDLPILITTTTLAMGVNLPAHLVIVKNTQQYVNGAYQEYSISTVLQMVGRAGRPQYDTEATAVIMTRLCDKPRYQALVGGSEPLQSYLHKRLAENLNSEAALGTVCDVAQCVQWLRSTFLYVRAARDPNRYLGLPSNAPQNQISKKIEELCVKAMNGLASSGLITMDEASCIESTEAGRLLSIFYLDLETMRHIMKIDGTENLEQLLKVVCESHELADMHLRVDERRCLNALNRNNAAATIRFPMKGKINTRQMKLNCIIQAILGCLPIPDPSLNQEAMKIIRVADRVCKCLVAYVTRPDLICQKPQYFSAVLNSLVLAKCVAARLWENSQYVSKQLKGIGPTFSTLLATAGKVNFRLLEESNPRDLERIMNKGPPSGNILRKQISLLPKYQLTSTPIDEHTVSIRLFLLNQTYMSENMDQLTAGDAHKSHIIVGDSNNNILFLTAFRDRDLVNVYDGCITYEIKRMHNFEHTIFAHCISSNFVGIDAKCEHMFHNLDPHSQLNLIEEATTKKTAKKQTSITDTFKERKRKNNNNIEISQSKEKKKRDNALIEKFKLLKESFGITSKELKKDLHKSEEITNKILKDLTPIKKTSIYISPEKASEKSHNKSTILHDKTHELDDLKIDEINLADMDSDEFMDDDQINSILNTIETEISRLPSKSDPIITCSNFTGPSSVGLKSKNEQNNLKTTFQKRKRKLDNTKSNYNFIDLLEKNVNLSDDECGKEVPKKHTGFSDAIKNQIEKYIHKTHDGTNVPNDSAINALLDDDPHGVIQKENEKNRLNTENNYEIVKLKKDTSFLDSDKVETDKYIHKIHKCADVNTTDNIKLLDNNSTCVEIVESPQAISTDIIQHDCQPVIHDTIQGNQENIVYTNTNENEAGIIQNVFSDALKDQTANGLITPIRSIGSFLDNSIPRSAIVKPQASFTGVIQYENQPVIYTTLQESNEIRNTENKSLLKYIEGNTNNVNAKPTSKYDDEHLLNNTEKISFISKFCIKSPQRKLRDNFKAIYKPYTHNKRVATMADPVSNSYSDITLDNRTLFTNEKITRDTNNLNNVDTQCSPKIMSFVEHSTKTSSDHIQNEDNSGFRKPTYDSRHDEVINKYSYSATKINVTTNDSPDHHIKIVRKLKIDLNITEIVSEHKESKTINELPVNNLNIQCPQFEKVYRSPRTNQPNTKNELKIQLPSDYSQKEQILDGNNDTDLYKSLNNNEDIYELNKDIGQYLITPVNNKKVENIYSLVKQNTDVKCQHKDEECLETHKTANEAEHNVENILQKYCNLYRNKATDDVINPQYNIKKDNRNYNIPTCKPKRPFNICNIEKQTKPLPTTLISHSSPPTIILPTLKNFEQETLQNYSSIDSNILTDDEKNPNPEIPEYQLCIDEHCDLTAIDYNIDQTMFDPKALLQCFSEDDPEFIPPPSEFCDETVCYSPEYREFEDTTEATTNFELGDWHENYNDTISNKVPQGISIFDDNSQVNLTSSKEIETWTLSQESFENDYNMYPNPKKSFTVVHEKSPEIRSGSVKLSRKSKLGQFKFNQKNKMKM